MIAPLLFTLIVLGGAYYFILYPYQKIKRIKRDFVVNVKGAEERYPDLPLGNIGILSDVDKDYRVRVIFPTLTRYNKVEYLYSWHGIRSVSVPRSKDAGAQAKINVAVAQELSALVREHVRFIEPEILALRKQWHKINKLLDLMASSEVYAGHQSIYDKALLQVEDLIDKAEELEVAYVRSIREILIGRQVAAYDPGLLPDNRIEIDAKYKRVRQEYHAMKDIATAHAELLRTRQI